MAILEKRHFYSLETLSFYLEQKRNTTSRLIFTKNEEK